MADQNEGLELETDVTQSDGASPVLLNAEIDHDGSSSSVTQVDLKFSESINSGTGDVLTDQTGIDLNVDSSPSSDIVTATAQDSDVDTVLQTGDGPKVTDVSVLGDGDSNSAELFEGSDVEIDTFRRQIGSGWNFVSFPIADGSSYAIQDLMPTENVDAIWTYDGEWKRFAPGEEENDFTEVKGGVGYQVKASDSFTLAPNVNNVDPDTGDQEVPTESVGLQNGWNLVGQFQEFEQVADQTGAFGSISADNLGEVREQSTGTDLQVIKQMNQDTTSNVLQVGEAYWVWAKESVAYTLAS